MKKFILILGMLVFFIGVQATQEDSQPSYLSRGVNWIKDKFGFNKEETLNMKNLKKITVPVLLSNNDEKPSSLMRWDQNDTGSLYDFREDHSPKRRVYYGLQNNPNDPITFKPGAIEFQKSYKHELLTPLAEQYEKNAKTFNEILPWLEKAFKKGQESVSLDEVNKQKYRYEGTANTLIAGGILAGAVYGGYRLYNWYKGPLNRARNDIIAAKSRVKNALDIVTKKKIDVTYKEKSMTESLNQIFNDLEAILKVIPGRK